ncbi:Uncharacterised protein [Salmonella enterica subsp. enterica serovar Bovismorbificans]|uniref:Uncharacterized protein n=1 Tax=Salmonella enterica subsp. enterica serovar Bovismorbificans TaxID=58097 RepID=A0A655EN72_SALET|nr:Uncharacterised protein [Salmonella enterica subsp. enterica serovar Bovismorbificans]CNV16495.1 Uncharacterised protein [Salmonella enterica subsp. enterica serovar Bovismorbificans]CNV16787.1 Uncharacterised protein [Salmonella enterica subsp. enterica serovar Bovismorbificans]CNV18301.1 Uncharacterised protein [Salmonella enterica subsp. enterica serovar Bovismorbificans]CNV23073.1 Uncharacterised protein [Salmonella enterica subsp. enterica serovar Bovismorbificans]
MDMRHQLFPLIGQAHSAPYFLEQLQGKLTFKLLNMKSYCRLNAAQLLRSPQKRALFHYRFQRNKPTQIHNHQPIENIEFRIKKHSFF